MKKDLLLLVADKNAHFALKGALSKPERMGIARIQYEFAVHPGRDGGTRTSGPELLALQVGRFRHALLVLDFEGSGSEARGALDLEEELNERLSVHWGTSAQAIVVDPELDIWMWGSSNTVESVIEWPAGQDVREWLRDRKFAFDEQEKPLRPKEAMEAALRRVKTPRSSNLYQEIAERISLRNCKDSAFQRLRGKLVEWFPPV